MTEFALRPLTVGEIIDQSLKIYRRSFGPMVTIALLANVVPVVLGVFVVMSGGIEANPVLWGVNILLSLVMGALATAATVFLVSEHYLGRQISAIASPARSTTSSSRQPPLIEPAIHLPSTISMRAPGSR